MKKHSIWSIVSLAMAVLCLFGAYEAVNGQEPPPHTVPASLPVSAYSVTTASPSGVSIPQPTLDCRYYIGKDFMASVSAVKEADTHSAGRIFGGIVPHHLLAGKMIATFFKTLSQSDPETLIIIAPNHRRIGHNSMNTSTLDWNTPFGILKSDQELAGRLISKLNISENNTLMDEEHSISSLVPYIKYYLPNVKIVPILLHGNCTEAEASELGKSLSGESTGTESTALIASVDFSHYLDVNTAEKMDEMTLKAIKAFDMQSIGRMGNDNLDSPPSVTALLSAMKEAGADTLEVTGHDNSSDITGKGVDYTTSYFTLFFRRPVQ